MRELERAVSLKPDDPVLNDHLGDAYWRAGRQLEATFQWAHARDMKPEPGRAGERPEEARRRACRRWKARRRPEPAELPRPSRRQQAAPPADREEERADRPAEPAAASATAAADVPAAYTVQPGQSLWSIAVDKLGNGDRYLEILNLNPQLRGDPGPIVPGQELKLPGSAN